MEMQRKAKKQGTVEVGDNGSEIDIQERIHEKDERLRRIFVPHEERIMWVQSLLVWEHPQYSAVLFVTVNIVFWLATYLRVFYQLGIIGFCASTWDLWSHYIWPEIRVPPPANEDTEEWTPVHPRLMSVPEICQHLATVIVYIQHYQKKASRLRKINPAKFFVFAMTFFICLGTFGCYVPGIYLVYSFVMGILLLPMVYYHDLHTKFQETVNPFVNKMEESMNIKRKRRKKSKKSGIATDESMDSSSLAEEYSDDSDEELRSLLPQLKTSQDSEGSGTLLRIPSVKDSDSDTGLTPRMTPNPPDAYMFDEDSPESDPSQMPSITGFEDSISLDPQFALQCPSELNLADISDNDTTYTEGLAEEDFDTDVDGKLSSRRSSKKQEPLINEGMTKAHTAPAAPLEFVPQHFNDEPPKELSQNDEEPKKSTKKKKSSKQVSKQLTLEDELAQGLEFDFDEEQGDENEDQEKSTQSQLMGNLLAGALSGAHTVQDTVVNIVASQMVSSIMQNTVSGFNRLGESVGIRRPDHSDDNLAVEKGTIEEQSTSKEKVQKLDKGQGSQESNDIAEEFEFLNEEDFDAVGGQHEGDK